MPIIGPLELLLNPFVLSKTVVWAFAATPNSIIAAGIVAT
jgi:hypothetical protein